MTKEQIDEIAMRVWNESESECDSRTGRMVITEFTHALLAELAKVQEPIGWYTEEHLTDKSATTYNKEIAKRWVDTKYTPHFVGHVDELFDEAVIYHAEFSRSDLVFLAAARSE